MTSIQNNQKRGEIAAILALALGIVTAIAFWGIWRNGFIDYDDNTYVFRNPYVLQGLTWNTIPWAFINQGHSGNWHPVTSLSHMLDVQLFGLNAGIHHLVNLIFHITNSILLLLLLMRMTGAIWRSTLAAGLFALHPLHVESVAWVSERKDMLSGFFFFLTLFAYAGYVQQLNRKIRKEEINFSVQRGTTGKWLFPASPETRVYYTFTVICFALGLMSKPMLVTVPFVLLLLDYWPLQRIVLTGEPPRWKELAALVIEKLPFFLLSFGSCVVTLIVQKNSGTVSSFHDVPLGARVENALTTYLSYLKQTVWPVNLAIMYPFPTQFRTGEVLGAAAILVFVTAAVLYLRKREPYLCVGWLWYLGMLAPVIGIVKVGVQARADRYTYLPLIGIFVIASWGIAKICDVHSLNQPGVLPRKWLKWLKRTIAPAAGILLVILAVASHRQVSVWRDTRSLFTHCVKVTQDNYVALTSLANLNLTEGRISETVTEVEHVLRIAPRYPGAEYLLGAALQMQGKMQDALPHLEAAVTADVAVPGKARMVLSFLDAGRLEECAGALKELLAINPRNPYVLAMEAALFKEQGQTDAAQQLFRRVITVETNLTADNPTLNFELAELYGLLGEDMAAARYYSNAVRFPSPTVKSLNNFAWLLATSANENVRNGPYAVELANQACEMTEWREPVLIGTLAAAYAEAGEFQSAIKMAESARSKAEDGHLSSVAAKNTELLELYRSGKAYHEKSN